MTQTDSTGTGEDHRYRLANRIAAGLAVAVGVVSCLALIHEGVPPGGGVELSATTKTHSTASNGCSKQCDKPKTTETETTVETSSPGEPGGRSVLERALNNDAGIIVTRILFALFAALATALVVRRIIVAWIDGRGHGHSGTAVETTPPKPSGPPERAAPEKQRKGVVTWSYGTDAGDTADADAGVESRPRLKNDRFDIP